MEAMIVGIIAPMVAPSTKNNPLDSKLGLAATITITIPFVALLDCVNAVKIVPINNSNNGKLIVEIKLTNQL